MEVIDTRLALIAENGDRLYPYKKEQRSTNRYGFALTPPGEQDRKGGGTYTEDIQLVVKKLILENWSARVKTTDKVGRQRKGTLGIGKRAIIGYELDHSLQHLIKGASIQPQRITGKAAEKVIESVTEKAISIETEAAIDEFSLRAIKTRRGQPEFRNSLLSAFGGKCCISNCSIESVLEAAHIIPHATETNYKVTNGILLRADIHTLFDLNLIGIDANGIVHVSHYLNSSEYSQYEGKSIAAYIPEETGKNLAARFEQYFQRKHR